MTIRNETVRLPVADGSTMTAHVARPAGEPAATGVIVAHELFGVSLVGEDDFLITAEQRHQIGDALRSAGVSHEIIVYAGTAHAFFWPGTPAFNSQSRDDAWTRILALLAS